MRLKGAVKCPICNDHFSRNIWALPCGHTYCDTCVHRLLNYSAVCGICRVSHQGEAIELFMDVETVEDMMDATISNLGRQIPPALDNLNVHSSRDEFQSVITLSEGAINSITDAAGGSGHAQTDELIELLKKQSKILNNKLKYKLQLDDLQEKLQQREQTHATTLAQTKRKADDRLLSLKVDLEKKIQEYKEQASEARRNLRVERDRIATEERRLRERKLELKEVERKANESCVKAAQVAEENTTLRNQLYNLRTENNALRADSKKLKQSFKDMKKEVKREAGPSFSRKPRCDDPFSAPLVVVPDHDDREVIDLCNSSSSRPRLSLFSPNHSSPISSPLKRRRREDENHYVPEDLLEVEALDCGVLRPNLNHSSTSQSRRNETLEEVKLKKRPAPSLPSANLVSAGLSKDKSTGQPVVKKSKTVNDNIVPKLAARKEGKAVNGFKQATLPFQVQQGVPLATGPKRTLRYREN